MLGVMIDGAHSEEGVIRSLIELSTIVMSTRHDERGDEWRIGRLRIDRTRPRHSQRDSHYISKAIQHSFCGTNENRIY